MVADPLAWIEPFAQAGADSLIFCLDSAEDPARVIDAIRSRDKLPGVSLRVEEPVELAEPYLRDLAVVTLLGTELGIKGVGMDPRLPDKIRQARAMLARLRLGVEIEADGGIRRETVPLIHAAGADVIVPGSLMFGGDPAALRRWLASL
jgi:ribulose-phosphate 3-epimerase